MKPGDRVIIRAPKTHRLGFLNATQGVVREPQPQQFEDEVSVQIDGHDSYYFVEEKLLAPLTPSDPWKGTLGWPTPGAPESPEREEQTNSWHFFEALLDSEEAHPNSRAFYNELIEAGLLHAQKQRDYGKPGDPFANVRSSEEWGISGWVGAMVRLNDKVKRLQSLARTGGLANESAIDSFRDIAVYALIALVLYRQEGAGA